METASQIEKLKKHNFKITPQRVRVIEFITNYHGHFRAEDVYRSVVKTEPSITVATVYNILKVITKSGIITSFEANGTSWYETNLEPHANFVCLSCGMIEDVPEDTSRISDSIASRGYRVSNVDLIVRGYCDKCVRSGKAV